jgi:hypothetical protein
MNFHQNYDIFVSYQWNNVKEVKELHEHLVKVCGYKVWRDETHLERKGSLEYELATNIEKSKIFLFCLTQKYYESINCKRELKYAINVCKPAKPIVFLMLESLNLKDLGDVGFLLSNYIWVQCYKSNPIEDWPKQYFEEIIKTINSVMPVFENNFS